MATHSLTLTTNTGRTLYAYPVSQSLADWTTHRVSLTEAVAPNLGRYTATLDDANGFEWKVFEGATQPGAWSDAIWDVVIDVGGGGGDVSSLQALLEADDILVEDAGVWYLHKYAKGTTTDLVTPKTAKQPGGANLTDPTTQLLAGYQE